MLKLNGTGEKPNQTKLNQTKYCMMCHVFEEEDETFNITHTARHRPISY